MALSQLIDYLQTNAKITTITLNASYIVTTKPHTNVVNKVCTDTESAVQEMSQKFYTKSLSITFIFWEIKLHMPNKLQMHKSTFPRTESEMEAEENTMNFCFRPCITQQKCDAHPGNTKGYDFFLSHRQFFYVKELQKIHLNIAALFANIWGHSDTGVSAIKNKE